MDKNLRLRRRYAELARLAHVASPAEKERIMRLLNHLYRQLQALGG